MIEIVTAAVLVALVTGGLVMFARAIARIYDAREAGRRARAREYREAVWRRRGLGHE